MSNFFRIAAVVVAIGSFATTSQAWNWYPSPKGYVAEVRDGECKSLVTVFWSGADRHGPTGWRIAFDNGIFINNLKGSDFASDKENGAFFAQLDAELIFRDDYCGTQAYNPTCPQGERPASQVYGCHF